MVMGWIWTGMVLLALGAAVLTGQTGALTAAALRTSAHFSWPRALLPGPFAALCDETIQLFVPGRSGQIADVWLDTAGYLTGALLTLLIFRLCRKWPKA